MTKITLLILSAVLLLANNAEVSKNKTITKIETNNATAHTKAQIRKAKLIEKELQRAEIEKLRLVKTQEREEKIKKLHAKLDEKALQRAKNSK